MLSATSAENVRAEFFYDPRNRCILRKYYTRGSQNQWVLNAEDSRALTYDSAWNLLTERTLDGQQVGEYIHGTRTDEILRAELIQLPLKPSTSTATVYPLADGLGSTVALTDDKGRVTQRYRYTAYGTPTALRSDYSLPATGSSLLNYRLLFTGREWLGAMGLNDHRNRYYSPGLGRWLMTDPIGFGGRTNLYVYVKNYVIYDTDSAGLCPPSCTDAEPLTNTASQCQDYGNETYLGTNLQCFCHCAGNSDWSAQVRGCLACYHERGTNPFYSHVRCYAAAGLPDAPTVTLSICYIGCQQALINGTPIPPVE